MSDTPAPAEQTPLEERLIDLIRLKGPISVADFMTDALGHPHEGYYMTQSPFGVKGDFTTAPEITQIFGELIGLWILELWRSMGSPDTFNLVELGPGRGVLMEDILKVTSLRPAFVKAANLYLLEGSGRLRLEQQKRLKTTPLKPQWIDDLSDIAPAPTIIIANEFLDCMPVRQFERTDAGWRERLIGVDENGRLAFTTADAPPPSSIALPDPESAAPDDIFEFSEEARSFAEKIATLVTEQGGGALLIDYGHVAAGFGDTLQAVRDHQYWPPLASPGRADLTAHVDFEAIAAASFEAGAAVYGATAQGRFLDRLGIALRVEMLCKDKPPEMQEQIRVGATRIAAPEQMGEIFKVICIANPELDEPAGFSDI